MACNEEKHRLRSKKFRKNLENQLLFGWLLGTIRVSQRAIKEGVPPPIHRARGFKEGVSPPIYQVRGFKEGVPLPIHQVRDFKDYDLKKMIPVPVGVYAKVDFAAVADSKYKDLLEKEYRFCQGIQDGILERVHKIYDEQMSTKTVHRFYCNFAALEKGCDEYKTE